MIPRSVLIAIGGNSLIRAGQRGTVEEQRANARETAAAIAGCVADGWGVIVTHGNGPQVGAALLRSERAAGEVYRQPLDVCVALTQSEIAYSLQLGLEQELRSRGVALPVASLMTQVEVRESDPAFSAPTKPIGPFYTKAEAEQKRREFGWEMIEDASRGYRRVVASPAPVRILELEVIRCLRDAGALVIALGGGGIPVVTGTDNSVRGVEAVIDKDRASAVLASSLNVDVLLMSTDEDRIYLHYKKPGQKGLGKVTVSEAKQYCLEGHFPAGSMGPKVESAVRFVEQGGREAIVTSACHLVEALRGTAGTHIVAD